jgi:hypothetical protein
MLAAPRVGISRKVLTERLNHLVDHGVHADGARAALAWALAENNAHPLTHEPGKPYPPDMRAITRVAREAKATIRTESRFDADHCQGVWECLSWIYGDRAQAPRP